MDDMNDKIDIFSFFDDRKMWEDIYNQSDCEEFRNYDSFDFPTSFVSIDFETLYAQRVSACSVGMVKYIDGIKQENSLNKPSPPLYYNIFKSWITGKKYNTNQSNSKDRWENTIYATFVPIEEICVTTHHQTKPRTKEEQ